MSSNQGTRFLVDWFNPFVGDDRAATDLLALITEMWFSLLSEKDDFREPFLYMISHFKSAIQKGYTSQSLAQSIIDQILAKDPDFISKFQTGASYADVFNWLWVNPYRIEKNGAVLNIFFFYYEITYEGNIADIAKEYDKEYNNIQPKTRTSVFLHLVKKFYFGAELSEFNAEYAESVKAHSLNLFEIQKPEDLLKETLTIVNRQDDPNTYQIVSQGAFLKMVSATPALSKPQTPALSKPATPALSMQAPSNKRKREEDDDSMEPAKKKIKLEQQTPPVAISSNAQPVPAKVQGEFKVPEFAKPKTPKAFTAPAPSKAATPAPPKPQTPFVLNPPPQKAATPAPPKPQTPFVLNPPPQKAFTAPAQPPQSPFVLNPPQKAQTPLKPPTPAPQKAQTPLKPPTPAPQKAQTPLKPPTPAPQKAQTPAPPPQKAQTPAPPPQKVQTPFGSNQPYVPGFGSGIPASPFFNVPSSPAPQMGQLSVERLKEILYISNVYSILCGDFVNFKKEVQSANPTTFFADSDLFQYYTQRGLSEDLKKNILNVISLSSPQISQLHEFWKTVGVKECSIKEQASITRVSSSVELTSKVQWKKDYEYSWLTVRMGPYGLLSGSLIVYWDQDLGVVRPGILLEYDCSSDSAIEDMIDSIPNLKNVNGLGDWEQLLRNRITYTTKPTRVWVFDLIQPKKIENMKMVPNLVSLRLNVVFSFYEVYYFDNVRKLANMETNILKSEAGFSKQTRSSLSVNNGHEGMVRTSLTKEIEKASELSKTDNNKWKPVQLKREKLVDSLKNANLYMMMMMHTLIKDELSRGPFNPFFQQYKPEIKTADQVMTRILEIVIAPESINQNFDLNSATVNSAIYNTIQSLNPQVRTAQVMSPLNTVLIPTIPEEMQMENTYNQTALVIIALSNMISKSSVIQNLLSNTHDEFTKLAEDDPEIPFEKKIVVLFLYLNRPSNIDFQSFVDIHLPSWITKLDNSKIQALTTRLQQFLLILYGNGAEAILKIENAANPMAMYWLKNYLYHAPIPTFYLENVQKQLSTGKTVSVLKS